MKLFTTIHSLLSSGSDCNIVIRKTPSGKLTVSVLINDPTVKDDSKNCIAPLIVKGTAEELDQGFVEAITTPMEEASGLLTSMKQFEDAKKAAEKKLADKKSADKKTSSAKDAKSSAKSTAPVSGNVTSAGDDDEDNSDNLFKTDAEPEDGAEADSSPTEEVSGTDEQIPEQEAVAETQIDMSGYDYKSAWTKAKEYVSEKNFAYAKMFMEYCLTMAPEQHRSILIGNIQKCEAAMKAAATA